MLPLPDDIQLIDDDEFSYRGRIYFLPSENFRRDVCIWKGNIHHESIEGGFLHPHYMDHYSPATWDDITQGDIQKYLAENFNSWKPMND